ncbi:hypothetical protein [Candidatus Tokpelaia sp.]|uniref:hypothetical protein n=1 Tax=Candidatus Tokpelaia sp. TaxID=2233777 RepID=UPI00123B5451|nr:hypothetical protein [Candidatus Tokpelaia sp.]KAA6405290.1 hypothetical protein DPQ22_05370 [Candidatus Tokpelaia sp.]
MEWYKNFGRNEKSVLAASLLVILVIVSGWLCVWPQPACPVAQPACHDAVDRLGFIGALISAAATCLMVWFIWWRDSRKERAQRRGTLYAFYGHICSVQANLMEQSAIAIGAMRRYRGGVPSSIIYIPSYRMPSLEHNLLLYAHMSDSPIFSRLIIELESILEFVKLQNNGKNSIQNTGFDFFCRERAIALCELLKQECQSSSSQIANRMADPKDKIEKLYKLLEQGQEEEVLPKEEILQNYKAEFLP